MISRKHAGRSDAPAGRPAGRGVDVALVALGAGFGIALALGLDGAALERLGEGLGDKLLSPLIAAANAGISCF